MNETQTSFNAADILVRRRRMRLAMLVLSHLALTGLAAAATWSLEMPRRVAWSDYLVSPLLSGLFGLRVGQINLLVCWGAFADSPWFLRIPRFFALAAWFLLLGFLGEYLLRGDPARREVEEKAAYSLLLILPPLLALFGYWAVTGCQFMPAGAISSKVKYQFSTKQLLLITAEVAALLALGRVLISWHPRIAVEFWTAVNGNRPEELIPAALAITILPAVFAGLIRIRSWRALAGLALYLAVPSFVLACAMSNQLDRSIGAAAWREWWQVVGLYVLDFLWMHTVAALTILLTFWLVRRIGYDFRRRGEGREEGNSSNARNSAASASA
jgi:hypothetical protein